MTNHTDSSQTGSAGGGHSAGPDSNRSRARGAASDTGKAAWEEAQTQFAQQSSFAAEQTDKVSAVLRNMADEFDNQDQHSFSTYTKRLAGYSDSLSEKLREKDLNYFVDEARDVSRRQPILFMGGAIAAGFVLSRFLRSSATSGQPAAGSGSVSGSHGRVYDAPASAHEGDSAPLYGAEIHEQDTTTPHTTDNR